MIAPERWKEVEALYHTIADRAPAERARLLEHVEPELRREVESLLDQPSASGALDRPAWENGSNLRIGSLLGPYRIEAEVGAGGMGRVYKARDTRVGRSVAIKQSHAQFSSRFQREATAIAALNHPNICTLYDVGLDYLVMEYIEGESPKGPLPLDRALAIAGQIAAALDAAHEKGIVHRDLKPGNIKIRPDGSVKVLDFGLAKIVAESQATSDSPTVLSASGIILGTAAYMAPEQARAESVDKRADVWAFGVVLYEMLTGSRLFDGPTASDCIADILRKEPDLTKVPARVRRLLGLCLEKDPQKRLRSLGDWQHLIEPEEPLRQSSSAPTLRKIAWFAVPAVLVAAAAGIWSVWMRPSNPLHTTRFEVRLPENVYFDRFVSVSPDGQKLVFRATGDQDGLWIHNLDTLEWRRLQGTERALAPFWCPDSRSLGFIVQAFDADEVKKIDLSTRSVSVVYRASGRHVSGGACNRSGDLLLAFAGGTSIGKVSAKGGPETVVTTLKGARGDQSHGEPRFLPDGRHFLYFVRGTSEGTYAGSIDDAPGAQPREPILAGVRAQYANGKLLFVRDGALMAQSFDAGRLALSGEPARIAEHVEAILTVPILSVADGTLAYRVGRETTGSIFAWFDRRGKELGTVGEANSDSGTAPHISPDDRSAAVTGPEPEPNIWILDFAHGLRTRFTFQPRATSAVWSPDGTRIYYSAGTKLEAIFEKAANGAGAEKELFRAPGQYLAPTSVSPDSRYLLYYMRLKPKAMGVNGETWVLPLARGARPFPLMTESSQNIARFSPDGRWVAYRSYESGAFQFYVKEIVNRGPAGLSVGEGKWQVSRAPVSPFSNPLWRGDSKELFYMSEQGIVMSVAMDSTGGAVRLGSPAPLFAAPCACGFDVTRDGQRFLVQVAAGARSKAPITVVLNWQTELKPR
jgi:Tol biopolymer transport system component/tRNA A-37 threonylcarbamoyl transferase component Bud32